MSWKDKIELPDDKQYNKFLKNLETMNKETKIDKVALAIRTYQPTIRIEGNTIVLPSCQRCGTETQKVAYSRMKARELIDELDNKG